MTGALNHPAVQSARQRHMERLGARMGREGPEGRTLAYGVVGMLESATFDWLRDRDTDIDRLSDLIFDFLWTGLSSLDRHGIALPATGRPSPSPTDARPSRMLVRCCGYSHNIDPKFGGGGQAGGLVPATRQQYQAAIVR